MKDQKNVKKRSPVSPSPTPSSPGFSEEEARRKTEEVIGKEGLESVEEEKLTKPRRRKRAKEADIDAQALAGLLAYVSDTFVNTPFHFPLLNESEKAFLTSTTVRFAEKHHLILEKIGADIAFTMAIVTIFGGRFLNRFYELRTRREEEEEKKGKAVDSE